MSIQTEHANQLPIPMNLVLKHQKPPKYRGLVVLVGKGRPTEPDRPPLDQAALYAIQYHQPKLEVCWLVASAGESGSQPTAINLEKEFENSETEFHIRTIGDPFDVQAAYEVIADIYLKEITAVDNLQPEEVIADFTGGVKPMTAGMIMVCGSRLPMQYMYGHKPGIVSEPRLIKFMP